MRYAILFFSLVVLSLILPEAAAQTQECFAGGTEGGIAVDGGAVNLIVADGLTGQKFWPQGPGAYLITEQGNGARADLNLETDNPLFTGTPILDTTGTRLGLPNALYVLIFSPAPFEPGRPTIDRTIRIAWSGSGGYSAPGGQRLPLFYHPLRSDFNADSCFRRVGSTILMTTEDITVATGSQSYINTHLGDEWTLPYDAYDAATIKMCPEGVCPTNVPQNISQFVSYGVSLRAGPLGPYALVPDYRFGTAVRVPATAPTQTWDVPGLTLRFKPFHTLSVGGTLALAGTTLTSTTTTGRWGGVTVDGGSLTMGAGSGIARVQGEVYHPAALLVTSGTALLNGATVAGTTSGNGVYVTGGSASAAISGVTDISLNASGAGVRVDAGGTVTVDGDGVQIHDNTEGIVASGAGTLANVYGGRIRDNLGGPGLRATSGARIEVLRLPPGGGGGTESFSSSSSQPVRLERNIGGLYATGTGKMVGGVIATETTFECVQEPCPPSPLGQHSFVDNNSGAAFDA